MNNLFWSLLYTLICSGLFYSFVVLDRAAEIAMSSTAAPPAQITVNEVVVVHDTSGNDVFICSFDVVTPPNSGEWKVRAVANGGPGECFNGAVDFGTYYASGSTLHIGDVRIDLWLLHYNEESEDWEVADTANGTGRCDE